MIDKSKQLKTVIKLKNDRLNFSGLVEGNDPVTIDYIPPLGDNLGYTSLELLLLSLSSCLGTAVLTFLRKMNKSVSTCEIHSEGQRKEEHPTGFSKISMEIIISSEDIAGEDMAKVIRLSEETYCPVLSMLKGNVEIEIRYVIV